MTKKNLTLVYASVDGVLGEYNHSITFPLENDYMIVYGPNGVGKTKFLEILHAAARLDGGTLAALPFRSATFEYSDGSVLSIVESPQKSHQNIKDRDPGKTQDRRSLRFDLKRPTKTPARWDYTGDDFANWLLAETSWRPIEPGIWEDRRDGEVVSISDLEHRYPESSTFATKLPHIFRAFAEKMPTFLIETQRLRIELQQDHRARRLGMISRMQAASVSKISEHATNMRRRVDEAQTEHSKITQQLDRTFPNRVLENAAEKYALEDDVRKRYNEQNTLRSRLGQVASVQLDDALSLPGRELSNFELGLLDLYLKDADRKLAPFEKLLQKIELLESIINSRLLNKKLQVNAGEGLRVVNLLTDQEIPLDSLSSGEQHEIILMFDLLFHVPEGALVLIDEPEISLHVVWQLAFIPDVQKIASLAGFRFIVATHSPQIINDAWSRSLRLGPPEVDFS